MNNLLSPVPKTHFKKWYKEHAFKLLQAGNGNLEQVIDTLSDYETDWHKDLRPLTRADIDGKNLSIWMMSNGVDEFLLVLDDMQGSRYSRDYYRDTGKQQIIIYVLEETK